MLSTWQLFPCSEASLESFSQIGNVSRNLGVAGQLGFHLSGEWTLGILPEVVDNRNHAAVSDHRLVASDELSAELVQLGLVQVEMGSDNAVDDFLTIFFGTASCKNDTTHLVEHFDPAVDDDVIVVGGSEILWVVVSMLGSHGSQDGH